MKFKSLLTGLILITSLIAVPSVIAGGGGIDTRVTSLDDLHWNILKVYFDPRVYTCKGMAILIFQEFATIKI